MTILTKICEWVEKNTKVIIVIPHPTAIGNCADIIYHNLLRARKEGKKVVLLYQYKLPWPIRIRLSNLELIDIASDYKLLSNNSLLFIIGSTLVTLYAAVFRSINLLTRRLGYPLNDENIYPMVGILTLWQPHKNIKDFSWEIIADYDWPTQVHTKLPIYLQPHKKSVAVRNRQRLGIPVNEWYVCLHVRESGYHNDTTIERDASILNYIEAIKEVTNRGGWVVRMGDQTMTKLPEMERVIDYPFTEYKSDLMDIYLISECRVYIGMQSGIFDVAKLFQRPTIMTNMANWFYPHPAKCGDVGVLKHIYSKSKKRFLSVREWMSEPFTAVSFLTFDKDDYILYENTPEELRSAVAEFFMRNGRGELTPLQSEFNNKRLSQGKLLLENTLLIKAKKKDDMHNRYRLACDFVAAKGVISDEYLQKNWDKDSYQQV